MKKLFIWQVVATLPTIAVFFITLELTGDTITASLVAVFTAPLAVLVGAIAEVLVGTTVSTTVSVIWIALLVAVLSVVSVTLIAALVAIWVATLAISFILAAILAVLVILVIKYSDLNKTAAWLSCGTQFFIAAGLMLVVIYY